MDELGAPSTTALTAGLGGSADTTELALVAGAGAPSTGARFVPVQATATSAANDAVGQRKRNENTGIVTFYEISRSQIQPRNML